jgi:hypothetical protein
LCVLCDCESWNCDEEKCREFWQCCYKWEFVNWCKWCVWFDERILSVRSRCSRMNFWKIELCWKQRLVRSSRKCRLRLLKYRETWLICRERWLICWVNYELDREITFIEFTLFIMNFHRLIISFKISIRRYNLLFFCVRLLNLLSISKISETNVDSWIEEMKAE